ncbi:MAG: orotate phosphoribosyltransferase [Lachnospiraceae bacterium]|nr:orotate phosphoribosyltransferase [Lachnospiraceae bacterium]MBQ2099606.1 orotate phosphoribosyltransferase [Lachnospiraceae bacterium]MBQ3907018.1 orotate phosphoribosyltransferase [Lachnospiraceae bacterium]MCR4599752.1 orotate phosphoribosyltransferase [Acetatifactor sp.]
MKEGVKINHSTKRDISMRVVPGHFVTSHSHINYYFDMTTMKIRRSEAQAVATAIAEQYSYNTVVDTIVCMDGCEVIGAYLAEALENAGIMSMNSHKTIYVVTPEINAQNQLIFRDNIRIAIEHKHVLLLLASATTGKTISSSLDCIQYYGGTLAGISALFSAVNEVEGHEVHSIFNASDVPQYSTYVSHECPMCRNAQKIDALVNSYGYSEL